MGAFRFLTVAGALRSRTTRIASLLLAASTAACAGAPAQGLHATPPGLGRLPYTDADVDFMAGMIPHHAQAVVMAGWAPSHGARADVAVLCERIVVAQRDQNEMKETWPGDRGQGVPPRTCHR